VVPRDFIGGGAGRSGVSNLEPLASAISVTTPPHARDRHSRPSPP
jgi:hypothetical protein